MDFSSVSSLLNVLALDSSGGHAISTRETPLLGYHKKCSLFSLLFPKGWGRGGLGGWNGELLLQAGSWWEVLP